jgi:hypothetical protein
MTVGASMPYLPTQEEQMSTLLYMYANMDEMVIGFIPIMELEKINFVWLKSNTHIICVVATHLSLPTR